MFKLNPLERLRNLSWPIKVSAMLLLIDQASKLLIISLFPMNINVMISHKIYLFPSLNLVSNPIFTSILKLNNHELVQVYFLLNLILILLWKQSLKMGCKNSVFFMGFGAIIAGGLSNGMDRMHLPGSIDWILIRLTPDYYICLNLADIAIEVGLIVLLASVGVQIIALSKQKKLEAAALKISNI